MKERKVPDSKGRKGERGKGAGGRYIVFSFIFYLSCLIHNLHGVVNFVLRVLPANRRCKCSHIAIFMFIFFIFPSRVPFTRFVSFLPDPGYFLLVCLSNHIVFFLFLVSHIVSLPVSSRSYLTPPGTYSCIRSLSFISKLHLTIIIHPKCSLSSSSPVPYCYCEHFIFQSSNQPTSQRMRFCLWHRGLKLLL